MKKTLFVLSALLLVFSATAQISVEDDGRILIGDNISGMLWLAGPNYSYASSFTAPAQNDGEFDAESGKITGKWKLPKGIIGNVDIVWKNIGEEGKEVEYNVKFPAPVPVVELSLNLKLPLEFGGKNAKFGNKKLYFPKNQPADPTIAMILGRKTVEIPLGEKILFMEMDKPATVIIMDNRKWNLNYYSIRILFPGVQKTLTTAQMKMQIKLRSKKSQE